MVVSLIDLKMTILTFVVGMVVFRFYYVFFVHRTINIYIEAEKFARIKKIVLCSSCMRYKKGEFVNMKNLKVLVTGGAGFIGSNLVDRLLQEGCEVVVVDSFVTGKRENINKQARVYELDVCDEELFRVFRRENFDVVFHLAGQSGFSSSMINQYEDAKNNILGTINVAKNCGEYNVKKLIFGSTIDVYDSCGVNIKETDKIYGESYNALSKRSAEIYLERLSLEYGIKYCILRYSNVYGMRQTDTGEGGIIGMNIKRMMNKSMPYMFGDEEMKRDFVFVDDVVEASLKAVVNGEGIYNIAYGKGVSQREVTEIMKSALKRSSAVVKSEIRKGEVFYSSVNIEKAKVELDWCPQFSIEEGISKMIESIELNIR